MIFPPSLANELPGDRLAEKETALRFRSITASQSLSVKVRASWRRIIPALLTRISTRPIAATAWSTRPLISFSWLRSA